MKKKSRIKKRGLKRIIPYASITIIFFGIIFTLSYINKLTDTDEEKLTTTGKATETGTAQTQQNQLQTPQDYHIVTDSKGKSYIKKSKNTLLDFEERSTEPNLEGFELKETTPKPEGYIIEFKELPIIQKKKELESEVVKLQQQANQIKKEAEYLGGKERPKRLQQAQTIESQVSAKKQTIQTTLNQHKEKLKQEHQNALSDLSSRLNPPQIKDRLAAPTQLQIKYEYNKVFNGISAEISDTDAEKIKASPYVKAIHPNMPVKATLMDSVPLISGGNALVLQDSLGGRITGKGIKIAILDTGVDYTHPDLGCNKNIIVPYSPRKIRLDKIHNTIYWSDSLSGSIFSFNTYDNHSVEIVRNISGYTFGLDPLNRRLYWLKKDCGMSSCLRAIVSSGFEQVIPQNIYDHTRAILLGMELDLLNRKLYWMEIGLNLETGYYTEYKIKRANLDGGSIEELIQFRNNLGAVNTFVLDPINNKLYWNTYTNIARLDISSKQREFLPGINTRWAAGRISSITIDNKNNKIYWGEYSEQYSNINSTINRADFDGGNTKTIISLTKNYRDPQSLELDTDHNKIYWIERGQIKRANIDGNGAEEVFQFVKDSCFSCENCKVAGGYDLVNDDYDPRDDMGHGTHVAGIAAGNGLLKGVAPDAKIYAYKVLDESGAGWDSRIIAGVEKAIDPNNDGDFSDHADIISMSLGGWGDPDDAVSQAVDNAVDAGAVVVVSAGNDGPNEQTIGSPGTARKAITVGATYKKAYIGQYWDDTDPKADQITSFSSRGPVAWAGGILLKPDIVAPGAIICAARYDTIYPLGEHQYYYPCFDDKHVQIAGTSMATPIVSGSAALIKQAHPEWGPEEIKTILKSTALDLNQNIHRQGYGRIDLTKAMQSKRPPVIRLYLSQEPAALKLSTTITGQDLTAYTIKYKREDKAEWNLLSQGSITGGYHHLNFTYNRMDFDSGLDILSVEVKDSNNNVYSERGAVYITNFNITQVGNEINYAVNTLEPVYATLNEGNYPSYKVYISKYQQGQYQSWTLAYSSFKALSTGKIGELNTDLLEDGNYRAKIVAKNVNGKEVESRPFESFAVLKSVRNGGFVKPTKYHNPHMISIESLEGEENNIILLGTEETDHYYSVPGYGPIGKSPTERLEIWRNQSWYKSVGHTRKGSKSYTTGFFYERGYAIYKSGKEKYIADLSGLDSSSVYANGEPDSVKGGLIDTNSNYLYQWPYLFLNKGLISKESCVVTSNSKTIFALYDLSDPGSFEDPSARHGIIAAFSKEGNPSYVIDILPFENKDLTTASVKIVSPNYLSVLRNKENRLLVHTEWAGVRRSNKAPEDWVKMHIYDLETGRVVAAKEIPLDAQWESIAPVTLTQNGEGIIVLPLASSSGNTFIQLLNSSGDKIREMELHGEAEQIIVTSYKDEPYLIVSTNLGISIMTLQGYLVREIPLQNERDGVGSIRLRSGDIDNDGIPEIIAGVSGYPFGNVVYYTPLIKIYDFFGEEKKTIMIPQRHPWGHITDIAITDYDNNNKTDLVVTLNRGLNSEYTGVLYTFDLGTPYNTKSMHWPFRNHDSQNTNCYGCSESADVSYKCGSDQLIGDVDGDGNITKVDANLLAGMLVGKAPKPDDICCLDVNKDFNVSIGDAMFIAQIANGMRTSPGRCTTTSNATTNEVCTTPGDEDNNGECDYDNKICSHGDITCPVGVVGITAEKNLTLVNTRIVVNCALTVTNVNSAIASIDNSSCTSLGSVKDSAQFLCSVGSNIGNKVVKCYVDTTKSYKVGDDKYTTIEVSPCTPSTCSTLGKQCGNWTDNCGGVLDCGSCPQGSTCTYGYYCGVTK